MMVWKGEGRRRGRARGSTRGQRVGGDRDLSAVNHNYGEEKLAVLDKEGLNSQVGNLLGKGHAGGRQSPHSSGTADSVSLQTEDEELAHLAGTLQEIRIGDGNLPDSAVKVAGEKLEYAFENLDADVDGRVENEVEVGVKKLIRLAASAVTSKLSEFELTENKQRQDLEVVALQSIYGSDYVPIDVDGVGPTAFTINIRVEISESLKIVAEEPQLPSEREKINTDNVASTSSSTLSHDNQHLFTVQALPPISLLCVLPPTYPSHSAPLFNLTCLWLDAKRLSNLCVYLDKTWGETSPDEVIFTWAAWLQSKSLCHLGVTEKLKLGPYNEKGRGRIVKEEYDERAISASMSFELDIPRLLRFNEEDRNKEFLQSLHMCYICFSEQPGVNFSRLPCQHKFCRTCMQQYCSMHVKDGSVINLICPDTSCKESVPPGLLKELLGKEAFERWEDLLLQKTLDSMADVVYCPRCESAGIEDSDHLVQCSKCFFNFCSLCMSTWHVGQSCMTAEAKLRILQGRQKGRAMGEEAQKKEKELINEVLNMKYINKEAKQCPTCKIAVQKSEGCNKMTCTNCSNYFCFKCGRSISGYEHFGDGSCILFDQEEIDRWEHQFNLQQLQHRDQQQQAALNRVAGLGDIHIRPCPNCRQPNLKEGNNNHMFCWACQCHYCALCNKMVRRSAEHFGVNKCKQHTAD